MFERVSPRRMPVWTGFSARKLFGGDQKIMTFPLGRPGRGIRSGGFTLVELLVVILIIVILVAILVPSLSMAREASKRAACSNNLAQIARAMITYDSALNNLPGWRMQLPGYSDAPGGENISWTVAILPQLGELDTFDWYDSFGAGGVEDVRTKLISRYRCPSAKTSDTVTSVLSYMGNGGTGAEVIQPNGMQYGGDGALFDMVGSAGVYQPGASSLARISVADGDMATLMVTERSGPQSPNTISWSAEPLPAAPNANAVATTHLILHPPTSALVLGLPPTTAPKTVVNPSATTTISSALADWQLRYPSSAHPGGVNSSFCDGRTVFIRDEVEPWVYCQILTSDQRRRSPRATSWELYKVGTQNVRYVFNHEDLSRAP